MRVQSGSIWYFWQVSRTNLPVFLIQWPISTTNRWQSEFCDIPPGFQRAIRRLHLSPLTFSSIKFFKYLNIVLTQKHDCISTSTLKICINRKLYLKIQNQMSINRWMDRICIRNRMLFSFRKKIIMWAAIKPGYNDQYYTLNFLSYPE